MASHELGVNSEETQWEEYNDSFDDPIRKNWATDGDWRLVGNGEITDKSCGSFVSFMGCIDTEKHKISDLEGKNYDSMVDIHLKHKSCYSYNCPICYLSWAVRAAHAINDKLESLGGMLPYIYLVR